MKKHIMLVSVLAVAIIAAACVPIPTPAPPTAAPAPAALAEANKALVRRYLETVLIGGRLDAIGEFVSPDYKRYLSPTAAPLNVEAQKKRLAGFLVAFPGLTFTIEDMITEGDRVAYRATARFTHQGAFQGIAPTGKQGAVTEMNIVRIDDGKIVEHWGGPDMLDLLQQLGAVVSVPPAK